MDGNPDSDFENGHCSHTNAANPSWWRVDLGTDLVPVSEIHIVNRFTSSTSLQQRNKDYKITLGESRFRADSWWYMYVYITVCVKNCYINSKFIPQFACHSCIKVVHMYVHVHR